MKASLESQRMYVNNVFLGSVAASAVMCCVLSLSSAAANAGNGLIDMSHAEAQCCFTPGPDAPITGVLRGPRAPGGAFGIFRVAGTDVDAGGVRALSGFTANGYKHGQWNDLLEVRGGKYLALDDIKLVGTALPPDKAAPEGNTTASESPANPDTTGATEGTDPAPTEPAGGEFTGSPAPSGPDLSSTEEEKLISGGWK